MSSDSDDDFSYTNTASMLKALKKDISFSEEKNLPVEANDTVMMNKLDDEHCSIKETQSDLDISCTANSVSKNNDSLVIVSDEEFPNSPVNLISKIDSVLVNVKRRSRSNTKRGGRGRGSAKGKCNNVNEDLLSSSENLISEMDSVLTRSSRRNRGRGRKNISNTRITRQNKRSSNIFDVMLTPTIVQNINNQSDVCVVDDNNDLQEANYDVDIKVLWMSQDLKKFSIRRFDKVQTIFKFFSERENIPENKLIFTIEKDGVILSKNDTPDSLNINAATIIEGGIKSEEKTQTNITSKPDKGCIEIKVQLKDKKRPLTITLKSVDRMEVLMHKTAIELGVNVKSLKFYFDGDLIKSNDTVENLQLEGGECIDCIKSN